MHYFVRKFKKRGKKKELKKKQKKNLKIDAKCIVCKILFFWYKVSLHCESNCVIVNCEKCDVLLWHSLWRAISNTDYSPGLVYMKHIHKSEITFILIFCRLFFHICNTTVILYQFYINFALKYYLNRRVSVLYVPEIQICNTDNSETILCQTVMLLKSMFFCWKIGTLSINRSF